MLGTFSTSPLAVTAACAAIANGGYRAVPIGVLAAVDGRGRCAPATSTPSGRGSLRKNASNRRDGSCAKSFRRTGRGPGRAAAWPTARPARRPAMPMPGLWVGEETGSRDLDGPAADRGRRVTLAGSGAPADLFRRIQNAADALDEQRRPSGEGPSVASSGRRPAILSDQTSAHAKTGSGRPSRTSQVPLPPMRPGSTGRAFPGGGFGHPVTSSPRPPDRG